MYTTGFKILLTNEWPFAKNILNTFLLIFFLVERIKESICFLFPCGITLNGVVAKL